LVLPLLIMGIRITKLLGLVKMFYCLCETAEDCAKEQNRQAVHLPCGCICDVMIEAVAQGLRPWDIYRLHNCIAPDAATTVDSDD
jgi:hypothetical protein